MESAIEVLRLTTTLYSPPVNCETLPKAAITACIVASRNTDTDTLKTVSTVRRLFRPRFLMMSRRYFIDASRFTEQTFLKMQLRMSMARRPRIVRNHDDCLMKLFV